jgi:S-adenosylmethionine:tRNA ribosyltransferase-isomerase
VRITDYEFELPESCIAQVPAPERTGSRLLVYHRADRVSHHQRFPQLTEWLRAGDVLVMNDSKVIHARLRGTLAASGGKVEMLLLTENDRNDWWALLKPGRRARVPCRIHLHHPGRAAGDIHGDVVGINDEGHRRVVFHGVDDIRDALPVMGEVPLPPYIRRGAAKELKPDEARYQTVVARHPGSVAAPTAGLHFTREFLDGLERLGVRVCFVTLHVGLGTFAPVKADNVAGHVMHEERYSIGAETVAAVARAKREGRRVVAVGTTSVRVLESLDWDAGGPAGGCSGATQIFIRPPHRFRIVDALLTNFHLPRSTLLMLVSAFAAPGGLEGRERILGAYAEAVREGYRFYSYGDAMLLV